MAIGRAVRVGIRDRFFRAIKGINCNVKITKKYKKIQKITKNYKKIAYIKIM